MTIWDGITPDMLRAGPRRAALRPDGTAKVRETPVEYARRPELDGPAEPDAAALERHRGATERLLEQALRGRRA